MADAMVGAQMDEPLDDAAYNDAIERAATRGSYWSGSRLFVALSAMMFAGGAFAFFYLHSLDSSGMWRTDGQEPPDYVSVPVLVLTLGGAALFWGYTRRLLRGSAVTTDWLVATGVSAGAFLAAAIIQFVGMLNTGFFPGSTGYASVYVAMMPVFAVYCLGTAYWLETLFARVLRVRWVVSDEMPARDSMERTMFLGSAVGAKAFVVFVALVSLILFLLFSVLS
jgi:heme/copper-type cytochrome/quinol oxidase subunit 3